MFRMMKLRQNVKGKLLSFTVSLSVLALTFVGAFAVSLKNAEARYDAVIGLDVLEQRLVAQNVNTATNYQTFMDHARSVISGTWYNNTNTTGMLVCALVDANNSNNICICIFNTKWSDFLYWDVNPNRDPQSTYQASISTSGSAYYQTAFGNLTDYLYCGPNGIRITVNIGSNSVYANSHFDGFTSGNPEKYFTPSPQNIMDANLDFYCSNDKLVIRNGNVIPQSLFLTQGPQSQYQNICFNYNGRCYFTFSDQSILTGFVNQNSNAAVQILAENNNQDSWDTQVYMYDLVYTGLTSYNGVSNVPTGGILAWDISGYVQQFNWDVITYSHVLPSEDYPNLFSEDLAIIAFEPQKDYWQEYYDYFQEIIDNLNTPHQIIPDNIPSYISQKVSTNYPGNIYVHDLGQVSFQGELPMPSMDQILVVDERIFDALSLNLGVIDIGDQSFNRSYCIDLMQQSDIIVILQHSDFDDVVANYQYAPDNYRFFWNAQSTIGGVTFAHGLWYMTSARIITGEIGEILYSSCPIITERYITKCNYYVLSDGIDLLYKGLNAIHDDQTSFFDSALSGFLSISAAIFANAETLGGKLDILYNFLKYDVKLSTQLQSIVDKLDNIADNTSEQTHDYWFISLYNWLLQFAPSNSDFATWVSDLTSFENQLPDPEATPAATVIPFPTVTAATG